MPPKQAVATAAGALPVRPTFTRPHANGALVLVRRVVGDIVERYAELCRLRVQLNDMEARGVHSERQEMLRERSDQVVEILNRLYRELLDVGCVLKDWRLGLVDFPAALEGRRVWLCWKLGETEITHWHEMNDGFAGRKPVGKLFD